MRSLTRFTFGLAFGLALLFCGSAAAAPGRKAHEPPPPQCETFHIDDMASKPLQPVANPPTRPCTAQTKNGFPIPDPACTPGAINPTLTADVLRQADFTTKCVRDDTTSEEQKAATYGWYGIAHPADNDGRTQTCELDHLISLELGGADTLDNIWPQCGPPGVALDDRYFKEKDKVENYLARMVKEGQMDLGAAQQGIATDWTQYLEAARGHCRSRGCD